MTVDELGIVQTSETEESIHLVIAVDIEEVLDGTALRVAVALRNLIALQPVATSLLGEEEHSVKSLSRVRAPLAPTPPRACSRNSDNGVRLI